jgi:flagellar hook-associated protein 3 FlgL
MRVSTAFIHTRGIENILDQQSKLLRVQEQLSRGVKNLVPSDDPGAAARVLDLNEAVSQLKQFDENAVFSIQRLGLEESTLDGVINVLQRTRELAIQAANTGTNDLQTQRAIAQEIRQRLDEVFQSANTKDAAGDYLFSGFQSKTQAFTSDGAGNYFYNGDQGQMALQIGSNRQVVVNDPGADVFQFIRTGNGVFATDASRTNAGAAQISTGTVTDPSAYQRQDFTINFTDATSYDVINSTTGVTLLTAQTYVDGGAISFNGVNVTITGTPATGDIFTVNTSRNQDIFTTLENLINDLENPGVGNVTGNFGGNYLANGFDVGDTVSFDLLFDGRTVPISYTIVAGDSNADIANGIMSDIAVAPNVTANGNGSFTLAGTTTADSMTFQLRGSDINFLSSGGSGVSTHNLEINNFIDNNGSALGNIASVDLTDIGVSFASSATVAAGGSATFASGAQNNTMLSQQIDNFLNNTDRAINKVIDVRTKIGGRMNSIDSQQVDNETRRVHLQTVLSDVRDLNFAEAVSNLTFQTTALQVAQQAFARVQSLSLFDFI